MSGLMCCNQHPDVRMKFWGICCIGGKAYKQVVNYRFHLTMAALDPKSFDRNVRDRIVTLNVIQHGQVFILCVLKHGEIQQKRLNLIFDKGDDITFSVGGYGTVNLTGYSLIDSQSSNFDMDNEHYCPVVEMGSEKQIRRLNLQMNGNDSKLFKALVEEVSDEDDDSDSDFSASAVANEEESSSEEDSEELDDEELYSEASALIEDIEEDNLCGELVGVRDDLITTLKSTSSQKRKLKNVSFSEKRIKKEPDEEGQMDDQSSSDQGDLNSSIGNTPMPKKDEDSAKASKKQKKKKRLSEISNLSRKSEKENVDLSFKDKSPKTKSEKQKSPVLRLEGGVECQDVTVGRGPVASKGKIVSIFYMGRLENKTIFDARTAPNKPYSFKLGVPEVIKGLDIGINGMRVGGQRKLKIPAKMGYGSKELEKIPPNSTLFFNVELMSVN